MATPEDILDRLAVACLRPGPDTLACRKLKERIAEGLDTSPDAMAIALGIDQADLRDRVDRARERARFLLAEAADRGFDLVTSAEREVGRYPAALWEIVDPPIAFWRRGPAPLDAPTIAIVGSRTATPAGLIVARDLSRDLSSLGYTIVSGLAAGVDGAAHEAALARGGVTVAVLGCGVDVAYPYRHRALAASVATSGCMMSESAPGTGPIAWHFPRRNRIISGLAQAVIVVEAARKSGSLITARLAMEQGRDVMAVPGSVASGRYQGCHALIRDGARLVETADDVLEELEGISARRDSKEYSNNSLFISYLEPVMARGEAYSIDDLAERTGRQAPELLADLGHLEIEGRVCRTSGGCFVRP